MRGFHVGPYILAYQKAFFPLPKVKKKTVKYCWWECKLGQPLWKTVGIIYWGWRFAYSGIRLSYSWAAAQERRVHMCIRRNEQALFVLALNCKQSKNLSRGIGIPHWDTATQWSAMQQWQDTNAFTHNNSGECCAQEARHRERLLYDSMYLHFEHRNKRLRGV